MMMVWLGARMLRAHKERRMIKMRARKSRVMESATKKAGLRCNAFYTERVVEVQKNEASCG